MILNNVRWLASKASSFSHIPRYLRELPSYVRGTAKAKTYWGDYMRVPFPEFRSIVEKGRLDANNEHETSEYFMRTLSEKDIFFDVGANAGFYSLLAAHRGAQVHAFEGFPQTFELLKQNTVGKNIVCHHTLVSDGKEQYEFMEEMERPGLNKISEHGTVRVPAITLDELGVVPTVMKIDVEGSEMKVLHGAEQMLRTHRPIIVIESSPEANTFLLALGYTKSMPGPTPEGNCLFLP